MEKESEHAGYEKVLNILKNNEYDIVIIDEAVTAHSLGLITDAEIETLISIKNRESELVLTGRGLADFLREKADLVTEMKEIKHYYNEGIGGREGIEF